jgi:peptidoglycan hydrolase CwlO-like protein
MGLTVMIGLGSSFAIPSAKAETSESSSLSQVKQERSETQAGIVNANQENEKIQEELAKLIEQTKRVDKAITDNNSKMEEIKIKIEAAKTEISQTEDEIAELEESIKNRTEILKQRAISYQHSGGNVEYIDVLVGSDSFSDFLSRAIAVGKIVEADRNIMEQQEADQTTLKEKQALKLNTLADLTNMKIELEGMHAQALEQKEQNDKLKEQLESKATATQAAIDSLKQKERSLASEEANIAAQSVVQEQTSQSTQSSSVEVTSGEKPSSSKSTSSSSSNKGTVEKTPVNSNGTVNDLIRAGYKYIGNSVYVFGGGRSASDIANGRFDCSGFVNWAFSTVGVSLSGNTDSLKHAGTQVSASNMQPGDLVFFNTYKTDGHVGIYVGGGKFIGSQSSTGVAIANMSSGYWAQKFNGRVVRVNL